MTTKQIAIGMSILAGMGLGAWAPAHFATVDRTPESRPNYEFVVSPGESPSRIRFDVRDAQVVEVDPAGTLVLRVNTQGVWRVHPHAYQTIANTHREVAVRFAQDEHGDVRFVSGPYDTNLPLVINPTVN
jgi:hypothetical protein